MTVNEQPVVLVPLDGSAEAESAMHYAQSLVPPNGELVLLHVVRGPEDFEGWWVVPSTDEEALAAAIEAAQRYLSSLADRIRVNVPHVRTDVVTGDPADEILRYAESSEATLVVMSTHGRGVAGRLIFGSVADRVARHGSRPTLLLRDGASLAPLDRIVVPLDGSRLAEEALPVAIEVAATLGAPVRLIHVVDDNAVVREIRRTPGESPEHRSKDDVHAEARARCERAAETYLAGHVKRLRARGLTAHSEVRTGTPAFVLLDLLRAGDLAVMTSHGLGGVRRWLLGSVAEKLVRHAASPVLLVHTAQASIAA